MVMDVFLDCLSDENVEVREMGSKALSGAIRSSQRQSILSLKVITFFSTSGMIWQAFTRADSWIWLGRRSSLLGQIKRMRNHYVPSTLQFWGWALSLDASRIQLNRGCHPSSMVMIATVDSVVSQLTDNPLYSACDSRHWSSSDFNHDSRVCLRIQEGMLSSIQSEYIF